MVLAQEIEKTKKKMINKWRRYGPGENFGQKEVRLLQDKYRYLDLCWSCDPKARADVKKIDAFENWCVSYDG